MDTYSNFATFKSHSLSLCKVTFRSVTVRVLGQQSQELDFRSVEGVQTQVCICTVADAHINLKWEIFTETELQYEMSKASTARVKNPFIMQCDGDILDSFVKLKYD